MTDSLCEAIPWERRKGVTVVECPSCGFCMDADHEDMGGGYSCPLCETTRLHLEVKDLKKRLGYPEFAR